MKIDINYNYKILFMLVSICISNPVLAEAFTVNSTSVTKVYVNGGADTVNPGTTCIKVSSPIAAACAGGYVALPNNNAQLLTAVLTAKTTGNSVWMYYSNDAVSHHCPGLIFTTCSLVSIGME